MPLLSQWPNPCCKLKDSNTDILYKPNSVGTKHSLATIVETLSINSRIAEEGFETVNA